VTVLFSVLPSQRPSGTLIPSVVIPSATTQQRPFSLDPVEHQHREADVLQRATHERVEVLAGAPDELARDRRLRDRPLGAEHALADGLARAREPPRRDAGEHLLEHHPAQRVTVSEVRVGDQPDLSAAVRGPHTRPLDTHAPPAERDLASLVAMTNRGALRVALALRAHDVVDLLFHQLGEHAEADADTQRQQPFLGCADQLTQRFLHAAGQHGLLDDRGLRDRYGLLHGGSSFDLWRITANAPNRNGRGGGTAVFKFYELRDNLRRAVQPGVLQVAADVVVFDLVDGVVADPWHGPIVASRSGRCNRLRCECPIAGPWRGCSQSSRSRVAPAAQTGGSSASERGSLPTRPEERRAHGQPQEKASARSTQAGGA